MTVDSAKLMASLKRKGFIEDQTDHHIYRYRYKGKGTIVWTKVSHGPRHDISNSLLSAVKKQMKLDSPQEVRDFAECTLTEEKYANILIQKGFFPA